MTSAAIENPNVYSTCFWSTDTSAQDRLMLQNAKSTKTLHLLSTFYKEFNNLEYEYSRKLTSLVNRLELPKNESSGTMKTSLNVFQDQCLRIAEAHSLQTRRVQQSLQIPLTELIDERKAREKTVETTIHHHWSELQELRKKCEAKSVKYENLWKEMSTMKSARLTLDNREGEKLEEKLAALKSKMLLIREDNWELVNKYNRKLESWVLVWWNTCKEWQSAEEKRIRFLKTNLWEFANVCSSFCLEEDQYSENMRVALQDCSAKKDIDFFVQQSATGDKVMAPLLFVDFAKGETRPLHMEDSKTFDIFEIPTLKKEIEKHHNELQKKKIPPAQLSESGSTAFTYIAKSKETYKELQEQAQKEVVDLRISNPNVGTKSISEPSTYKVMSDYSNPTTGTSVYSNEFDDAINRNAYKSEANESKDSERSFLINEAVNKENFNVFELKNNVDIMRDSLSPAKSNASRSKKHNSFANAVKHQLIDNPKIAQYQATGKFEFKKPISHEEESSYLNKTTQDTEAKNVKESRRKSEKEKNISNTLRKSKSQIITHNKHVSVSELPKLSSEGYPVISYCRAIYSYNAAIEEELSFRKRDILLVLHKQPDQWWFAENLSSGDSGLIPSNYMKDLK